MAVGPVYGCRGRELRLADRLEIERCHVRDDAQQTGLGEAELSPVVVCRVCVAAGADGGYEGVDVSVVEEAAPEFAFALWLLGAPCGWC